MRVKWRLLGALTVLVLALTLVPAVAMAAPAITQGIKGVVKSSATGLPIPFAEVHVDISGDGHIDYFTADWDGTYSIALDPNDYYLEAYSRRYAYQEFEPVTVTAGAVTTQNFSLDEEESPDQPVYRFFNMKAGVHFYTANDGEFLNVYRNLSADFHYDGIAYYVPWGAGSDPNYENPNTMPLYRFFNKKSGVHFFTMSEQEKNTVINTMGDMYTFEGVAYWVTDDGTDAMPIHRFYLPSRNTHFFTGDSSEIFGPKSQLSNVYQYEGIGYFIGDWVWVGGTD